MLRSDGRAAMLLAALALSGAAQARTAEEAQALDERAVAHIRAVGREQGLADITRPDGGYVDGELYVYCGDSAGVIVAHGGNPKMVGHNILDVRDSDGRLPLVESLRIGLASGSGWLEFRWPNPLTKRVELKETYILKVDDATVCGAGYYKGEAP